MMIPFSWRLRPGRTLPALAAAALILMSITAMAPAAHAQVPTASVLGRVIQGGDGGPVAGAAVLVRNLGDSTAVSTSATGAGGHFRITGVPTGSYFLEIRSLGYRPHVTVPFRLGPGAIHDLGLVELAIEALTLDPVSVVEARSVVVHEADRTSYLLEGLPSAHGGTLSDALRDLPELEVDIDGNVALHGEAPAIWLNGRPVPMTGGSLAHFLEQFPAELIDRIEVLDSPGSEFDAEGAGGIINIVLREDVDLGFRGRAFTHGDTRGSRGVGGQGTWQADDWLWEGSGSLRRQDSESDGFSLRQNLVAEPTDFVQRDSWTRNRSLGANMSLRSTYTPREEARYWLGVNAFGRGGDRDGLVSTTHMDDAREATMQYDRASAARAEERSVHLRAGFEWRWDPRSHVLDAEVRYGQGSEAEGRSEERVRDHAIDASQRTPPRMTLDDHDGNERQVRFDLRYRRPLGEHASVRTGYSFRDDVLASDRVRTILEAPGDLAPRQDARGFDRHRTFNSAYLSLQRTVAEGVALQAGVRAEHVDWDLAFPSSDAAGGRYFDVFPSFNLSWSQGRTRRVRLSYTQRVTRPPVRVLDPTDRSSDPLERVVGNPEVEPRYTHRLNLNASWSGHLGTLALRPYLSRTVNSWERITTVDAEGVTTRTWDNLSRSTRTGASINYSFRNLGQWRGSANVSGSLTHRDADNLDERFSGSFSRWSARLNMHGPLHGDLTAQTSLRYTGAGRSIQGWDGPRASADVSFRYRLLDDRLSASLALRDPFGLRRTESEIHDRTVWEIRRSSQATRSVRLTLSYALGGDVRRASGGGDETRRR